MDKRFEKTYEKVRKYLSKNQVEKADNLVKKALESAPTHPELLGIRFFITLKYGTWPDALNLFKQIIRSIPIQSLFSKEIFDEMLSSFSENPAFKSALFEFLLNNQLYVEILYILQKGGSRFCESNGAMWEKASKEIEDDSAASNWAIAAGIAYIAIGNQKSFYRVWRFAVEHTRSALPALINFCQQTGVLDLEGVEERIFLIDLFFISGIYSKGLALMNGMAQESKDNAKLLIHSFLNYSIDPPQNRELVLLKTKLAIKAEEFSLLAKLQGEWQILDSDLLFQVQKSIAHGVLIPAQRKKLLLSVVQAYFVNEDWESSSQLLESLYKEDPDPEVLALMEYLLQKYPFIPHLHSLVGDFQLERGMIKQAIEHYGMVMEVPQFKESALKNLEICFLQTHSPEIPPKLIEFFPDGSAKIAILGIYLLLSNQNLDSLNWFPTLLFEKSGNATEHPYWTLFHILYSFESKEIDQGVKATCQLMDEFPEIAYEIVPLIIANANLLGGFSVQLISSIKRNKEKLSCYDAWKETIDCLERSSSISQNLENSDFFDTLHQIEDYLDNKDYVTAFQMVQRLASKFEDAHEEIINFLDANEMDCDEPIEWMTAKLSVLLRKGKFDELIRFGKELLVVPRYRKGVSTVHQYLGWAYESTNEFGLALEHFCYGSLEKQWFHKNLEFFKEHLFPAHAEKVPNVLALVNEFGDATAAQEIAELWFQYQPQNVGSIFSFFEDFSNRHSSPQNSSNLVYWAIQAREFSKARDLLKGFDPRNSQYGFHLPKIVQLLNLKQPQDPTARFLLGRFYLYQGLTSQAVDLFRTLIQDLPHTLEDVFIYLKKALKKGLCRKDLNLLYGLLIRIALDQRLFRETVELLRDFGSKDAEAARSFVDGVFRVLKNAPDEKQAYFEFLQLNAELGDYSQVCELEDAGILGNEMYRQRLEWLRIASSQKGCALKAKALQAGILYKAREFDECRQFMISHLGNAFSSIKHDELLEVAQNLLERFPDDWQLKRLVAFQFWKNQRYVEAEPLFSDLLESGDRQARLEAFALLREMGQDPSFSRLLQVVDLEEDTVLGQLNGIYRRIRKMALEEVNQGEQKPNEELLFWLLDQGETKQVETLLNEVGSELDPEMKRVLWAYVMRARGEVKQAAFSLVQKFAPKDLKKMFFLEAGLWEQALLLQEENEKDPSINLRIWSHYGRARELELHVSHSNLMFQEKRGGVHD